MSDHDKIQALTGQSGAIADAIERLVFERAAAELVYEQTSTDQPRRPLDLPPYRLASLVMQAAGEWDKTLNPDEASADG